MKNGICYIIGAGEDDGLWFKVKKNDFVIAADGGYKYLKKYKIIPDLIIGDFDSLGKVPKFKNIKKLNPIKDETDTFCAVVCGLERGYESFHIHCATGGRFDHTMANLQLLTFLSKDSRAGFLFNKDYVITAISNNKKMIINKVKAGFISIFSFSNISKGVTIKNLKYELNNATLKSDFPLGVSNEFIGKKSEISIKQGTLLIVFPRYITLRIVDL